LCPWILAIRRQSTRLVVGDDVIAVALSHGDLPCGLPQACAIVHVHRLSGNPGRRGPEGNVGGVSFVHAIGIGVFDMTPQTWPVLPPDPCPNPSLRFGKWLRNWTRADRFVLARVE
jgi:hypothetical protein